MVATCHVTLLVALSPLSTQSEVVVPVVAAAAPAEEGHQGQLLAVLDVDSDHTNAFDEVDAKHLEALCSWLAEKYSAAHST